MAEIELRSPALADHAPIPPRHARQGDNLSPPLGWRGVPGEAVELVLVCEDPDASTGTFLHWPVTGIDPASEGVGAGQIPPAGSPRTNSYGEQGWGGPQPPAGDPAHHYVFQLYALDRPFSLPGDPTPGEARRTLGPRQLAEGTLVGLYQR